MKKFLKTLFEICESFGKARAAAMFTRMGDYEAAKKVMQDWNMNNLIQIYLMLRKWHKAGWEIHP